MRFSPPFASAVLSALAVACAESSAFPPLPEQMEPDHGPYDVAVRVEITGRFTALVDNDFSGEKEGAIDASFQALLLPSGDATELALEEVTFDQGKLLATVPAGVPLGSYDLVVVGPDGQRGVLRSAYRAVTSAESVASFEIGAIGPQRAGIPFFVVVTALDAEGHRVVGFEGAIGFSEISGLLEVNAEPFQAGRMHAELIVGLPVSGDVLAVEDALGNRGASLPFDVVSDYPAALVLGGAPASIEAGHCSDEIELYLVDGLGRRAEPAGTTGATLLADPPLAAFFGDPACAVALSQLTLDPSTSVRFFLRADRAGTLSLRLTAPRVPSVRHELQVLAAAPAQLGFASPPRRARANTCSPALEVGPLDPLGNPSPPADALSLPLRAEPPQGISFFSDPACSNPIDALLVEPGQLTGRLHFRSSVPGRVLVVAGEGPMASLSPASQLQLVMP